MAKERKYKGFVIIHRSMQDHWLWKSKAYLSDRWAWSRPKVDRYIDRLKSEQMIEVEKNAVGTVITVLNYDTYQSVTKKRAGDVTPDVTAHVTTHVNHLKNVNKTFTKELKEDDSFFE